jgi:hypothetical protein
MKSSLNSIGCILLIVVLVTVFASPIEAQTDTVVTLDSGTTVQLCASCSPRELRLAVTAKKGLRIPKTKAGQEDPTIIEVSYGNVRDTKLRSYFVPRWELSPGGVPQALLITVTDDVRKAGNYDLVLSLQPKTAPLSPRLKLQIVHAAAKLGLPDKLLVNQTEYWPFCSTVEKMQLDLRETTDASDVVDVDLDSGPSMQGTELVTGKLTVTTTPPAKQPFATAGKSRPLEYSLTGDFPLGVVSGWVRFRAKELPDPAVLNFEVHSRLTKFYIFLAIVLGLGLSWYLKVYLHDRIELADAISKAASLLDNVQADLESHHDQAFHDTVTPAFTELRDAIEDRDAAAIAAKMPLLDAAWKSALQAFTTENQEAVAALDEIRGITGSAWILPQTALKILSEAKSAPKDSPAGTVDVAVIQEQLVHKDPTSAAASIIQLRGKLGERLRERGIQWHDGIREYLKSLAEASAGMPADVLLQFAAELEKNTQQLNSMNFGNLVNVPNAAAIIQFLRDFESEYRTAIQLLRELALRLGREWAEFTKVLRISPLGIAKDPQLFQLKSALDDFATRLPLAASEPQEASKRLENDLGGLQEKWKTALVQLAKGLMPKLDDFLQKQEFLGAAQQIATARAKLDPNFVLGDRRDASSSQATSWPDVLGLWPMSSLSVISSSPQLVGMPPAFHELHVQSRKDLRVAKGKQTLIVGAVFILWAYGFYSKTFGGTWSDVSTIFFAAFGFDITLDALLSKVASKSS